MQSQVQVSEFGVQLRPPALLAEPVESWPAGVQTQRKGGELYFVPPLLPSRLLTVSDKFGIRSAGEGAAREPFE